MDSYFKTLNAHMKRFFLFVPDLKNTRIYRDFSVEQFQSFNVEPGMSRQDIESFASLELETVDAQIPDERFETAADMAQEEVMRSAQKIIDREVLEKEFGMNASRVREKLQEIAQKIGQRAEDFQKTLHKKYNILKTDIEKDGVFGVLQNAYESAEESVQASIKEVIVENLKDDIHTKTHHLQPDWAVKKQAEIVYEQMDTKEQMMYLMYVGQKRTRALPGDVVAFLKEAPQTIQQKFESVSHDIQNALDSPDPVDSTTPPLTAEERSFLDRVRGLGDTIQEKLSETKIWEYLKNNYSDIEDVPEQWHNSEWINDNTGQIAGAAATGVYVSTFTDRAHGFRSMITWAAVMGGLAAVPKISMPAGQFALGVLRGTGKIVGDGAGVVWRSIMSVARGTTVLEMVKNPRYALDGKWASTRQQEVIRSALGNLDDGTREFVPDKIRDVYDAILDNPQTLTAAHAETAADFCVQSMDRRVFMDEDEFDVVAGQVLDPQGRGWDNVTRDQMLRMLNTAYQQRIMKEFITLPDEDPRKVYFKKRFTEIFAERKLEEEHTQKHGGLNLEELYADSVDIDNIATRQRRGLYGDLFQNKSGLATIGAPILAFYLFSMSLFGVRNLVEKVQKRRAEKKLEKTKDGLPQKTIEKLSKELQSDTPSQKKILKLLKSAGVLTAMDTKKLQKIPKDDFREALKNGAFPTVLGQDLQKVSSVFWADIGAIPSISKHINRFEAVQMKSQLMVQKERFHRQLLRGEDTQKLSLKGGEAQFDIFEVERGQTDQLRERLRNLRIPGMKKEKSFVFRGRLENKTGGFALVETDDAVKLYQIRGGNTQLKNISNGIELTDIVV